MCVGEGGGSHGANEGDEEGGRQEVSGATVGGGGRFRGRDGAKEGGGRRTEEQGTKEQQG